MSRPPAQTQQTTTAAAAYLECEGWTDGLKPQLPLLTAILLTGALEHMNPTHGTSFTYEPTLTSQPAQSNSNDSRLVTCFDHLEISL